MATLQELNRNLQAIRKNLSTYEAQKTKAVDDLRTANTSLKDLSKTIRELEETMSATDKIISSQKTDDALKTKLEEQRAKLDKELQEAKAERTRFEKVITAKTEAENNITSANSQMDKIILEFASDPRINGHLQEAINYKYTDEITKMKKRRERQIEDNKKFSSDLKNDRVFGKLVTDLTESYKEYKKIPEVPLDDDDTKKANITREKYYNAIKKLRDAISSKKTYENLNLSEEDFLKIISGPNEDGEYVLPTLEDRVKSIERAIAGLEDRKLKIISKIKEALVPERVDPKELARLDKVIQDSTAKEQNAQNEITRIQGQIADLKQTFKTVDVTAEEQALKDAQDKLRNIQTKMQENGAKDTTLEAEITDLNKKISVIGFDQTRFAELKKEAGVPAELTTKKATAEAEFEKAKKALKDTGYISEDLYPEMKNYTAEIDAFREADKNVRKAFLECETNDSPENREALKKAMEAYKTSSGALTKLSGMEGLTVENWHDWLVRDLRDKNTEEILADYYYDETVNLRLNGVRDEYKKLFKKSHTLDTDFEATEKTLGNVKDMQEAFLRGDNVEFTDVETGLDNYKNSIAK